MIQSSQPNASVKRLRSSLGFSLVEVLVAVAILSIVSLGVTTSIVSMNDQMQTVSARMTLATLQSQLYAAINKNCSANLTAAGNTVKLTSDLSLTNIKIYPTAGAATDVISGLGATKPINGDSRIYATQISYVAPSGTFGSNPLNTGVAPGRKYWTGDLLFDITVDFKGVPQLKPIRIGGVSAMTDAAGNILTCGLTGGDGSMTSVTAVNNIGNGTTAITYSSDPSLTFGTVFTAILTGSPLNGTFGLACNPPFVIMGCVATYMKNTTTSASGAKIVGNQCIADRQFALVPGNSSVYATCGKF